jgi:hypothetical protein
MGSAATRRRPHAFVLRHQLMKMMAAGISMENSMARWSQFADVRTALQVSKDEAKATANITMNADKDLVEVLGTAVKKFGFIKGPVAHSALASNCICLGSKPQGAGITSYYAENMALDAFGSKLLADRMIGDWLALPPAMRKSWTGDSIGILHLKVTGFVFACRIFQSQVASFDTGCMKAQGASSLAALHPHGAEKSRELYH